MEQTAIPLGDAMNLCNNNNGNMWNNPFMYLVWLALFNGNGFGWGNRAEAGYNLGQQTAEIQNAIYASNDQQTISQQIRGIANGLSEGFSSVNYALGNAINNGFANTNSAINEGFDRTNYALMENKFAGQQGVTAIQQAIAETNYNNSQNTCKITTAIHEEGEATRALITQTNIQALRDKLAETGAELQNARFEISQQAQNQYLVNKLGGCNCGCNC